ncbi:benzaldehyde dehydrogenase [Xanthomonas vesicatoria]|nr:benzaldehyde dehydrogenase [Xanthomonas vesicatoria]
MNALPSAAIAATATPAWHGCIFNGEWIPGHGGALPIYEPATGGLLHEVSKADLADVAATVAQAKQAQRAWAATAPRERAAVFHRAAQAMQARSAEAALLIARETGGILPKAQREVDEAVAFYQHSAGLPLQAMGQVLPTGAGQLSLARHMPLGVVAVISPFNFPLILSLRSVAPALAMGNAVILKPDPRTPYTGGVIIAQVLEEAGLPKGLLHVLHGDAQIGQALVEAPDIPMIAFTGSTAAGRRIGEIAGRHLKKVALELGGNNAVIVLDDADLDRAASAIAFGAYMHQGQICMAAGRVLVQRSVAEALTQRLGEKARHLPVGDPVSGTVALGPIIDQRQLQRVIDIVTDSVAAGAVVEAGATNEGLFYAPTVLSNVRPGMRVFDEEVFGPVINITVFDTD